MSINPQASRHLGIDKRVIEVGQVAYANAYKAATDAALLAGRDEDAQDVKDEADVAGKNASLEARKAKIAELLIAS